MVSEGDKAHGADAARQRFKVTGTGVTVGVLSDGVDSLAASIASGDLPADTRVLPGQAGDGDEGTAMMEIVHDLAPNAHLIFATAFTSEESFADNIRALRAAGADIIVDDVVYFAESPFQDSGPAQAVIDVTNDGALYFSSAGNEQNVDDRTAGNWEGDYDASGQTIGKFAGEAHDWDPGPLTQVLNPVSDDSAGVPTILQWNDLQGHSGNDYDLYAVGSDGSVLAFSNDVQDGNDDPFEGFNLPFGTVGLAVVKFSGANRYFQLTPFRGRFENRPGLNAFNTPGVTRGHSAVPAAFSVAAVPAAAAFPREIAPGVPNPAGPFPSQYTRTQQSETFTSDGPRRVFYNPDGTRDHAGQPHLDRRVRPAEAGHRRGRRREHLGARLLPVLRHLGDGPARGRDRGADPLRQPGDQPGGGALGADRHRDRHRGPRLRPGHRLRHRDAGAGAQADRGDPAAAGHRRTTR